MRPGRRALLLLLKLGLVLLVPVFAVTARSAGGTDRSAACPTEAPPAQQRRTGPPPQAIRFERLSIEDGLSQSTVRCILQDGQGYMWFATNDGLNKYDGYRFTVYRHDPDDPNSLNDNRIETIFEDRSAMLWVSTRDGSLARLDRENDEFVHYNLPSPVRSMYEDSTGTFWIGTDEPGLLQFDRDSGAVDVLWRGQVFKSIYEDRHGVLWAGNRDGFLGRYDRALGEFVQYEVGYWVEAIGEGPAGQLWVGTAGGGLARFDRDTEELTHYRHDPNDPHSLGSDIVPDFHVDDSGVLWVAAYRGGLNQFDPNTGQFTRYQHNPVDPYSLSGDLALSLHGDRSGVLWIGTELGGLSKLGMAGGSVSHFRNIPNGPNSLGNNNVTAIHKDHQGVLWIGTRGGLDRFDRASGQWRHYRHDAGDPNSLIWDYVGSIYEDRTGALWIGTGGGLDRYDRESERFSHYPVMGYGMHEDRTGTYWVTAEDGLYRFDRDADRFNMARPDLLQEGDFWSMRILEDAAGMLWLGTAQEGLGRYDPSTDEWRLYQHDPDDPQSLSHNSVESILEDQSGVLWVGTSGGLNRFDRRTEVFTHYRMKDGLPSDAIWGILEDQAGNLWLSTNLGLSRFDPHSETFHNYDVGDGLQGNQFARGAYHQSPSGEMFFGGFNGFNAFYPDQIADNPHIPPVVITAVSLFNEVLRSDLGSDEHIELPYQDNFLSFDFAALDYSAPDKNQYAYMMEGLDEDWIHAGARRHADYPNLRPGSYLFRAKGSNNDGVWNEDGAELRITITPPVWQTAWFQGLAALLLLGIAAGGYRLRVRSIEARSHQLEQEVTARTTELSETNVLLQQEIEDRTRAEEALAQERADAAVLEERNRLARELHDSVTQALYGVTLYAEAAKRMLNTGQVAQAEQHVRDLGDTAQEALAEMRLLIFELRPLQLEEQGLIAVLQSRLESVEGRAGLQTEFNTKGVTRLPPEVEQGLFRVAQEALNNVLKHARATKVGVSLRQSAESVVLEIRDDGVGFDPAEAQEAGGLGLKGIAERAELLGGSVTIESAHGDGARVRVEVPR